MSWFLPQRHSEAMLRGQDRVGAVISSRFAGSGKGGRDNRDAGWSSTADSLMLSGAADATSQTSISFLEDVFSSKRKKMLLEKGKPYKEDKDSEPAPTSVTTNGSPVKWQRFIALDPNVPARSSARTLAQLHHAHLQRYIAAASAMAMAQAQAAHVSGTSTPLLNLQAPVSVRAVRPVANSIVAAASGMPSVAENGTSAVLKTNTVKWELEHKADEQGRQIKDEITSGSVGEDKVVSLCTKNRHDRRGERKSIADSRNAAANGDQNGTNTSHARQSEDGDISVVPPDASKHTQSADGSDGGMYSGGAGGKTLPRQDTRGGDPTADDIDSASGGEGGSNSNLTAFTKLKKRKVVKPINTRKKTRLQYSDNDGDENTKDGEVGDDILASQSVTTKSISSPRIMNPAADSSNCSPLAGSDVDAVAATMLQLKHGVSTA